MKDTGWKAKLRESAHYFAKWGEYMKRAQLAERKVEKLRELILLTDPVVSNVPLDAIALSQWNEFIRVFPDEAL